MTILPPNNARGYVTDEDRRGKIDNLPAGMLLAPVKFENSVNNGSDHVTENGGFEPAKKKRRKSVLLQRKWRQSNKKNDLP